jgi:hypothetical protein
MTAGLRTLGLLALTTVPLVGVGFLVLYTDAEMPWLGYLLFGFAVAGAVAVMVGHYRRR